MGKKEKRQYKLSDEGRRRLREAACRNRPWERSTGPKTPEGKLSSARNGIKHGTAIKNPAMEEDGTVAEQYLARAYLNWERAHVQRVLGRRFRDEPDLLGSIEAWCKRVLGLKPDSGLAVLIDPWIREQLGR